MNSVPNQLSTEEAVHLLSKHTGRLCLAVLMPLCFGLVQGFRFGFASRDYAFLAGGSILTVIGAFIYGSQGLARASSQEKSWSFLFVALGAAVAYLFIVYLTFYRGLWAYSYLLKGFRFSTLCGATVFTFVGLSAITQLFGITEVVRLAGESSKRNNFRFEVRQK